MLILAIVEARGVGALGTALAEAKKWNGLVEALDEEVARGQARLEQLLAEVGVRVLRCMWC